MVVRSQSVVWRRILSQKKGMEGETSIHWTELGRVVLMVLGIVLFLIIFIRLILGK